MLGLSASDMPPEPQVLHTAHKPLPVPPVDGEQHWPLLHPGCHVWGKVLTPVLLIGQKGVLTTDGHCWVQDLEASKQRQHLMTMYTSRLE
jgi:hypothetical protein